MSFISGATKVTKVDGIEDVFKIFKNSPLPPYNDDYHPSEFEYHLIRKKMDDCQTIELNQKQQRWLFHRLIPCLIRYGTYPPSEENS